jgi:hypothetical protein
VLKKSVGEARIHHGKKEQPSLCITDAQSVKNTDTAAQKGYDAGKKVSGILMWIRLAYRMPFWSLLPT